MTGFTYHAKMHVGVVLTPPMQAALYDVALIGRGQFRPRELSAPRKASFGALVRRGLIGAQLGLTELGHSWIKAEVDAAHASTGVNAGERDATSRHPAIEAVHEALDADPLARTVAAVLRWVADAAPFEDSTPGQLVDWLCAQSHVIDPELAQLVEDRSSPDN